MSAPIGQHWTQVSQGEDLLGADFISRTFAFPGPKTQVHTTLVHHIGRPRTAKAILYVHGYTDYFFQKGLAEHFIKLGYRFYAVDLQGYGRSIRPSTPPNWCDSIEQYGQDLDIALATMRQDGVKEVVIMAHSTGGLIASSYLAQPYALPERESHYNRAFPEVTGLILNSPFLALPFPPALLNRISWPIRALVSIFPFAFLRAKKITTYAKTLHTRFGGEWDYRLDWKPAEGFNLSFHWLKEIIRAQHNLATQKIDIPTLLCRSEISTIGKETVKETQQGDGVLDIDSMEQAAEKTFSNLDKAIIPKGFHDLYLSHQEAREAYLSAISKWLKR
ncbi:alpha/beta hydrolase [Marinomonas sp. 2405UD66-6]|uniref:alpha/beta hydrolase n=1 Tax=Marinomonas sp. 2405UD66-6 TaxID=3391834 RepID=UPI0039C923AC